MQPISTHRITFLNTSFGNILSRTTYNSTFAYILSKNPTDITSHPGSDMGAMCEWIAAETADCVALSEIPGSDILAQTTMLLQSYGYTVYATEGFDFWSQNEEYQLFQLTAIRGTQPQVAHQVFYKKYPWLYALFYGIVGGALSRDFGLGKKIFVRLISGVRDGAITTLEYSDHSVYLGHIHYWCPEIEAFLSANLGHTPKPALIMGDMNVPAAITLLKRDFFKRSAQKWEDALAWVGKTFGFSAHLYPRWMRWFMYESPDILLTRWLAVAQAQNITSLSDHNRIAIEYSVPNL